MEKRKAFVWIFVGVIAAGVLVLGVGLILNKLIVNNPVITVVTLFAMFAGGIMAGLGLIALLISLLLLTFKKSVKNNQNIDTEELNTIN